MYINGGFTVDRLDIASLGYISYQLSQGIVCSDLNIFRHIFSQILHICDKDRLEVYTDFKKNTMRGNV
jgi:hypothetical protein